MNQANHSSNHSAAHSVAHSAAPLPSTSSASTTEGTSTAIRGRFLAVDTATESASLALWVNGQLRARHSVGGRQTADWLRNTTAELLAEAGIAAAQLDGLACGIGPGSFAGVRTGVSFAQGIALSLERRLMPVISLELLASALFQQEAGAANLLVAATLDARMGEVYHGIYRAGPGGRPLPVAPPVIAAPDAVPAIASTESTAPIMAAGSGWAAHAEALRAAVRAPLQAVFADALPDIAKGMPWIVPALAAGRGLDPAQVQPLYLRNKVALTSAEQSAARRSA